MKERYGNIIGGREDFEGERATLRSPADGSHITEVVLADRRKTEEAIDSAADAFRKWSCTTVHERQDLLLKLAERIQSRAEEYSLIETMNTGKTIRQSTMMDVPLGIEHIRYFARQKTSLPHGRLITRSSPARRESSCTLLWGSWGRSLPGMFRC